MPGCLRWRKRSTIFYTTAVLAHGSLVSFPCPRSGWCLLQGTLFWPHRYRRWRLLYPYNTAFSSFLGAHLTLSTPECLLQEVPRHLLSYDCPGTLLLPLFPTPVLHTYHPTLLRLSWGQYGSCSGPPATCLRSLSPRVLCHQFPFSLIRAHLSTQRTPYLFCSLRYPKFLLYAACQRSILSTPRGLRTMHHHVNTLLLLLPGDRKSVV